MAKRALLVEDSSQPFSGVFPFGPELLEVSFFYVSCFLWYT